MKRRGKKGQVWIETVLYTLIAFVMIGLVLAYAKPRIEEAQDKAIVEQSVEILENINNILTNIERVPGNKRIIELMIKKGTLRINGNTDSIVFEIESRYPYTEAGEDINIGNIIANTRAVGSKYDITLTLDYSATYDLTYRGVDQEKIINRASTAYSLVVSNEGASGTKIKMDFDV